MKTSLRFVDPNEFRELSSFCRENGYWTYDLRVFLPGFCWFAPWLAEPERDTLQGRQEALREARAGDRHGLSVHYWEDWAEERDPITVVCPNGRLWVVDQVSSNGVGWKVTGEVPLLTASPSIVVPGYHGYLTQGVFSADLEGRGENGTMKEQAPSKRDLRPNDYS